MTAAEVRREGSLPTEDELILQAADSFGWTAPRDRPYVYLLARDEPEDDALARGLEEHGFAVLRLPLLATAPGRDAARLAGAVATLPPKSAIVWTSHRAAEALAAALGETLGAALRDVPLFALGPAGAAPVARAGLAVRHPEGPLAGSAKGLAEFVAARAAEEGIERALFLAGNRSLPDLPEALAARHVPMERLEVYETVFLRPALDELDAALGERRLACAVFFSPSGAEALEAVLAPEQIRVLREVPTAAKGPTTAAALRARGYRSVDAGLRAVVPRPSHPLAFLALHLMDETRR
jgi:uroporphyrinogen-III synthase